MVRVSIEVCNGSTHYCNLVVRAQNIEQAVGVVRASYPDCFVRVKFPIDPKGYFIKEAGSLPGIVGRKKRNSIAA